MSKGRLCCGVAIVAIASGCGGPAQQLAQPPAYQPAGQTKCKVRASSDRPLVIEWPSSDRAELEAEAKHGLVVVRYSGCEMELLPQCHVKGSYRYTPTTRKLERVTINNEDDLYAQLPIGAARLEGTLAKAGQLVVSMNVVGRYDAMEPAPDRLDGLCDGATHVVTGLTAGAFEFYAGASAATGGGIGIAGVGAGAKSTSDKQTLDRDGDAQSCTVSKSDDTAPPDGCGALLRVEVAPLGELASLASTRAVGGLGVGGTPAVAPPAMAGPTIPPGDGIVRVHIESPDPSVELRGFGVSKLRPSGAGFESLGPSTILCRAPCDTYVDARMGQSMIISGPGIPSSSWFQLYDRSGDVDMSVRPGNSTLSTLSIVGYSVGILAVLGGGSTLLTGALIKGSDSGTSSTGSDLEKWGGIVLGGGAVLIGASVVMDLTGSTKVEIKPGAGAVAPH